MDYQREGAALAAWYPSLEVKRATKLGTRLHLGRDFFWQPDAETVILPSCVNRLDHAAIMSTLPGRLRKVLD